MFHLSSDRKSAKNSTQLLKTVTKTLPKVQRTQGIEYFDSFNTSVVQSRSFDKLSTWVLMIRLMEKNSHIFLRPNCRKLQNISKNVSLKNRSKGPQKLSQVFKNGENQSLERAKIPLNLTSEGQKYPPEVRVQHETCSTICRTPVQ